MPNSPLELFVDILADDLSTALISETTKVVYAVNKIKQFRESNPDLSSLVSPDNSITIFGNYIIIYRQFSPDEIIITLHDPKYGTVPTENMDEKNIAFLEDALAYIHDNYDDLEKKVALVKDI